MAAAQTACGDEDQEIWSKAPWQLLHILVLSWQTLITLTIFVNNSITRSLSVNQKVYKNLFSTFIVTQFKAIQTQPCASDLTLRCAVRQTRHQLLISIIITIITDSTNNTGVPTDRPAASSSLKADNKNKPFNWILMNSSTEKEITDPSCFGEESLVITTATLLLELKLRFDTDNQRQSKLTSSLSL